MHNFCYYRNWRLGGEEEAPLAASGQIATVGEADKSFVELLARDAAESRHQTGINLCK